MEMHQNRINYLLSLTVFDHGTMVKDETGLNSPDFAYFRDIILTPEVEPEVLWKLKKYKKQLEAAALYGDDLENATPPVEKVEKKRKPKAQTVWQDGNFVHFQFKVTGSTFHTILTALKNLGARCTNRDNWTWTLPVDTVKTNKAAITSLGFDLPELTVSVAPLSVKTAAPSVPRITSVFRIEGSQSLIIHAKYNADMISYFKDHGGFKYNAEDHSRSIFLDHSTCFKIEGAIALAKKLGWEIVGAECLSEIERIKKAASALENTKKDFSIELDINLKVKPFPYQQAGIQFIDLAGGRALVGDEMGLGKTMQGLGWVIYRNKKALVICPNSFKLGWKSEIAKFSHATSQVLNSKTVAFEQAQFTIINYENVGKHDFSKLDYDTIIIDESHKIKNPKTLRYKNIEKITAKAKHVILLSGTAIVNRPNEFFTQLKLISPSLLRSKSAYEERYCDGHMTEYGWKATGSTNLDELIKVISPVYLRRTKAEVLTDLPAKTRQDIVLSGIKIEGNCETNALAAITKDKIALAKAKVKETIDFVENMVESGDKVIVFSDYIDCAKEIAAALGDKAVRYLSELSIEERQVVEKEFQTNPDIRVFVATTKVAGVALTLTAANKVVFNDMPWTPGDLRQCEDRAHRVGQKGNVTVYKMVADGTLDSYICELLNEKSRLLDIILDGKSHLLSEEEKSFADRSVVTDLIKRNK